MFSFIINKIKKYIQIIFFCEKVIIKKAKLINKKVIIEKVYIIIKRLIIEIERTKLRNKYILL